MTTKQAEVTMAERLRRLRQARGLTQARLAAALEVPLDSYRKWEQPGHRPRLATLIRLAAALGVTLGQLAGTEPLPTMPQAATKRGGKP